MTAPLRASTLSTKALRSYPLSAMTYLVLAGHPSRRSEAAVMLAVFPPVRRMRTHVAQGADYGVGFRGGKLPHERPSACFCCPLLHSPHADVARIAVLSSISDSSSVSFFVISS